MAALCLSVRDDSKMEQDILVFSADKVDTVVPAGSTPSRAQATRASEIACDLPATSRVPCYQQKLPATLLPNMAEKMEGIQMGVDPSKYPVPIET
jgi:hypothetical protein